MTFRQWIAWFVGTPPRLLTTIVTVAILWGLFHPQDVHDAVSELLNGFFTAIEPFKLPMLALVIGIAGSIWAFRKALSPTRKPAGK